MLPIPFIDYIPKFFNRDNKLTAMSDKSDEHLEEWKSDIKEIDTFKDAIRIDSNLINELGFLLSAGIKNQDSLRTKKEKVYKAIMGHKLRGTWNDDAKPKVDAIAGGDSQIVQVIGADDFVLIGDGNTPSGYFWSVLGGDGVATDYGIRLVGEGDENVLKGIILIDTDNSGLTVDEVEQIKLDLEDVVPAYFIVKLGYVSGGIFVEYPNGQIG